MEIQIKKAITFKEKLLGLMFKKTFKDNLLLQNCSSIHTFWMRFSIDIICLNKKNVIIQIIRNIRPYHIFIAPKGTNSIIETQNNINSFNNFKVGNQLTLKEK